MNISEKEKTNNTNSMFERWMERGLFVREDF